MLNKSSKTGSPYITKVLVISLGIFIVMLDTSIVNIVLPEIMKSFDIAMNTASWIISAYSITVSILYVTSGKLADVAGKKVFFVWGLLLFMVGSFFCGISGNVETLIFFRVVQGIAGAMVMPASLSLVRSVVPKEKIGFAMGLWSAVATLAIAIGPSMGGIITEYMEWRWVFYINVPVILIAVAMTYVRFKDLREVRLSQPLDLWGMATISTALFFLTYSIVQGQEMGWSSFVIVGGFVAAGISILLFILIETRVQHPLIDFNMFKNVNFLAGCTSIFLGGMLLMGLMAITPIYLTKVKEFSTLKASFAITPVSALILITAPIIGKLIDRYGFLIPMLIGYIFSGAGFFLLSQIDPSIDLITFILILTLTGVGIGIILVTSITLCTVSTPEEEMSVASGVFSMLRNVGAAVGVALFISITVTSLSQQSSSFANQVIQQVEQSGLSEQTKEITHQYLQSHKDSLLSNRTEMSTNGLAFSEQEWQENKDSVIKVQYAIDKLFRKVLSDSINNAYLGGIIITLIFSLSVVLLGRRRPAHLHAKDF